MAVPRCTKNRMVAVIFPSEPEKIPEKLFGRINPEIVRLSEVAGIRAHRIPRREIVKGHTFFRYDYQQSQSEDIDSTYVRGLSFEGWGNYFNGSSEYDCAWQKTGVTFYVDLNADGKRETIEYFYRWDNKYYARGANGYLRFTISDPSRPCIPEKVDKETMLKNRREIPGWYPPCRPINWDKYNKALHISNHVKMKQSDAMENIRILDIDLDSDLDIVVSLNDPFTLGVENFVFRNQMCKK